MTWIHSHRNALQRTAAVIAIGFGLATILAGTRVLRGGDPGYFVFRPLLVFNTVMGVAYAAVGLAIWRDARWSTRASGAIAGLNVLVFGAIVGVIATGGAVAIESLGAMALRSGVWIGLYAALAWMRRARQAVQRGAAPQA